MYQVILIGVRDDVSRLEAVKNLAVLFKTTTDQVEKLLAASGFVLKKGIAKDVAVKYKAAIEAAGGVCSIESEEVLLQTLEVDIPPSTTAQEPPQPARSNSDEMAMMGIGDKPEKHSGVVLSVTTCSPQKNKPRNSDSQAVGSSSQAASSTPASPPSTFRILDNPSGYRVYVDVGSIKHYVQNGNQSSLGIILLSYDSPVTGGPRSYQSEWQLVWANCSARQIQTNKVWLKAGPNFTGETIFINDKPGQVSITEPGTESETIRSTLCLSESEVSMFFNNAQQILPAYPPIQISY
jgi:hypothetical protein